MPDAARAPVARPVDPATKIVEAVAADPVVQAAVEHASDPAVQTVARQAAVTARQAEVATESETSLRTGGQRRINLIWEITQSLVALSVTCTTLFVAGKLAITNSGESAAFLLLSNVFFLVLGTYFSRTNHIKVGGVGREQEGR